MNTPTTVYVVTYAGESKAYLTKVAAEETATIYGKQATVKAVPVVAL